MTDEWGIDDGYFDVRGEWQPTPPETREVLRQMMGDPVTGPPRWFVASGDVSPLQSPCDIVLEDGTTIASHGSLPPDLPTGYHRLLPLDGGPSTELVVHPARCPAPARMWGVAAQIYSLWSEGSWGIGDLTDVAVLAGRVAGAGGGALLLSPLHAPSPEVPQELSPYFPTSRRWWSPLLVRPRSLRPPTLRCDPGVLIDRDLAWPARRAALAHDFHAVRHESAWRIWADDQGAPLVNFARWCALAEVHGSAWRTWPEGLRRPDSAELDTLFASEPALADAADLYRWIQWRAWQAVAEAGRAGAGLITDLAVGFSPDGADAWVYQDLLVLQARIGAPSDTFNPDGQDWGLPPFNPSALAASGFAPLLETARAALHGASGLRVDHVMGLFRQFWIPDGGGPDDGAYVRFAGREQLALLALEAERAGAFLVGEDLGVVEPMVREQMTELGVLGTLVGQFEDEPPEDWRELCLATLTTHDLPTSAGIWTTHGVDDERRLNFQALAQVEPDAPAAEMVERAQAALLGSPPLVRLLTTDDLCGSTTQPNSPGTVGPPNWSVHLPLPVDQIPLPDHPI